MNQLSIFVFGLFVSLAQFALQSEGGNVCSGCLDKDVVRPEIPPDLQHLSNLEAHLIAIDRRLEAKAKFIRPWRLAECAGRYMKSEFGTDKPRDQFESLVWWKVIVPCQQLNNLLEGWYKRVKKQTFISYPDPWYLSAQICNEIVKEPAGDFMDLAYAYLQSNPSHTNTNTNLFVEGQ